MRSSLQMRRNFKSTPLAAEALDRGAARRELILQPLEAAVEAINAVDDRLALGRERGDDERDPRARIRCHHRRALERANNLDGRPFAVALDDPAKPHQLP